MRRTLAATTMALLLTGVWHTTTSGTTRTIDPTHAAPTAAAPSLDTLNVDDLRDKFATLPVKGRSAATGYKREAFMRSWPKVGGGCDLRDVIARRDATDIIWSTSRPCHPTAGVVWDPYTGQTLPLGRADVDHVVPLKDAWAKGARDDTCTTTKTLDTCAKVRAAIATDPDNLLLVSAAKNRAKQDADMATWLPPNKSYRCTYAVKIITIKHRYHLWTTPAEHQVLNNYLTTCFI